MKPQISTVKHGFLKAVYKNQKVKSKWLLSCFLSVFICVNLWLITSCQKPQPTDMRQLAPAETLVYLESKDLGEMLQALTQNQAYKDIAEKTVDFSTLKNTQVAVIVSGFETSEKQLTGESSILNFKPHFVLIADTHAWKSAAVSIAENQLGNFVKENYGADVKLEKAEKRDAKFFTWTAKDGRKLFSAVAESILYAGNDETLLDKCLAVKRGEADNLLKNEALTQARAGAGENLTAFGYISTDGAAQIANLVGVSVAINASEEDVARSFIAKTLPTLLQKSVKEVTWTARKNEQGIEDKISFETTGEVSSVLKETMQPTSNSQFKAGQFLPAEFSSITRYNLQNPSLAWQSLLLTASKQTDALSGKILNEVSGQFFEPYGIINAETFLSGAGSEIVTAQIDEDGDKSVVMAEIKDEEKIKKSISTEINFKLPPEKQGIASFWKSKDGEITAAFVEGELILGDSESVLNCLKAKENGQNFAKNAHFEQFAKSSAATVTIAKDTESALKIVNVLGNPKDDAKKTAMFYMTETRFTTGGVERRTVSDFGLIGTLVEQFDEN